MVVFGYNGIDIMENNLLDIISKYPDSNLLLARDVNARCGDLQDISSNDELDYILNNNYFYENDDFNEERKSKDSTTNTFGISLIELCKSYGIHIVNGRSKPDDEGESTCTANEGCSIVDYCIIASKLLPFLCSFEISHRTESFHFPVEFSFDFFFKRNYKQRTYWQFR